MQLEVNVIALSIFAGIAGGLVRGYSGFGFAMTSVPILSFGMPPLLAIPCVLIHELLIGLFSLRTEHKEILLPQLLLLCIGTMVGTPIGIWALSSVPTEPMKQFISVALLISVAGLWFAGRKKLTLTRSILSTSGFVSGLLNGAAAISGPPIIITLLGSDLDARKVRSLSTYIIAFSAMLALALTFVSGLQTPTVWLLALYMTPGVIVGAFAGIFLFNTLPHQQYKNIALSGLFIIALLSFCANYFT